MRLAVTVYRTEGRMTWHVFSHSHGGLFRDSSPRCLGVQSAPAKAACLLRTSAVSVCRCTRSVHTQAISLMPLAPVLCRMPPVCVWPELSHLCDTPTSVLLPQFCVACPRSVCGRHYAISVIPLPQFCYLSSVLHTPVCVAGIKPSL